MKKTTMRIVGFLLAAAALVLATGCPQPDTPKKPEPAPAPSVTNFDVQQLKGMNFKVDNWNSAVAPADDAYLCFSNEASTKLTLVAKDGTLKKRDAAVAISFSGNNVTIAELGINGKAFAYDKTANKITITTGMGANDKIVMTKSDESLSGAAADADKVVAKFNTMMGVPAWVNTSLNNKLLKVVKKGTTALSANKKLYLAGTSAGKVTLAVDTTDKATTKANAESDYSVAIDKILGSYAITLSDLDLTDVKFSVKDSSTFISEGDQLIELVECSDPTYDTVTGWGTTDTPANLALIFN